MGKYAYVTFIIRNDGYLPGALVLGHRLKQMTSKGDLVCLVSKDISAKARKSLKEIYDYVIEIEEIYIKNNVKKGRQDRPFLFTRIQALRLGLDGDLGLHYKKIVLLDADIMPLSNYDHLFNLSCPAGILNEKKAYFIEKSRVKDEMLWHQVYKDICPHGHRIPKKITDRVWTDPENLGVNACLWVLEPSMVDYNRILLELGQERNLKVIAGYRWPEMQFMTYLWSGNWYNIDLGFAALNGQPNLKSIYGTHFAGIKPWQEIKSVEKHYSKFEDYQVWFKTFHEMCTIYYPKLKEIPKFRRLIENIEHKYQLRI